MIQFLIFDEIHNDFERYEMLIKNISEIGIEHDNNMIDYTFNEITDLRYSKSDQYLEVDFISLKGGLVTLKVKAEEIIIKKSDV